jgi:hypothetical protein
MRGLIENQLGFNFEELIRKKRRSAKTFAVSSSPLRGSPSIFPLDNSFVASKSVSK